LKEEAVNSGGKEG